LSPIKRRDIGNGAERHAMQHAEQIGLRHFGGPEAARAQLAIEPRTASPARADGGEMAEAREVVRPVRVTSASTAGNSSPHIGCDR